MYFKVLLLLNLFIFWDLVMMPNCLCQMACFLFVIGCLGIGIFPINLRGIQ